VACQGHPSGHPKKGPSTPICCCRHRRIWRQQNWCSTSTGGRRESCKRNFRSCGRDTGDNTMGAGLLLRDGGSGGRGDNPGLLDQVFEYLGRAGPVLLWFSGQHRKGTKSAESKPHRPSRAPRPLTRISSGPVPLPNFIHPSPAVLLLAMLLPSPRYHGGPASQTTDMAGACPEAVRPRRCLRIGTSPLDTAGRVGPKQRVDCSKGVH
jgi:hypothetical protein